MIRSTHPIPLSMDKSGGKESAIDRLFLESRCFGRANEALVLMGLEPVNWCLDDETDITVRCSVSSPPLSPSSKRRASSDDDNNTSSTKSSNSVTSATSLDSTTEGEEEEKEEEEEGERGGRSDREARYGTRRCFGRANEALARMGLGPVDWCPGDEIDAAVRCPVSGPPPSSSPSRDVPARTALRGRRTTEEEGGEEKEERSEGEGVGGGRGVYEARYGARPRPRRVSLHHCQRLPRNSGGERTVDSTDNQHNRMSSFLRKKNERVEHEERQIRLLQGLAVQEREPGWESQGEIVTGTGEDKGVMARDIERLNDNMERRDATIGNLSEELARTKREATRVLEEAKEADAAKRREIVALRNTVDNLMAKSDSFGKKVAKKMVAGMKKARVLANEIERLNDGMKQKDATINNLNEELTRTKKEALEEATEAEATKQREITVLKDTMDKIMTKSNFLGDKVAKLESGIANQETKLKDAQSKIVSQTQLALSSARRSEKEHSDRVAVLRDEIDDLNARSESEATVSRQNATKLKRLEETVAEKEDAIRRLEGCAADAFGNKVSRLKAEVVAKHLELEDARGTIASMKSAGNAREIFDPLHFQARLAVSTIDRLKRDHSNRVAALDIKILRQKTRSENEAIASRQNVAEIQMLEKIVAEKDEVIKRQRGYCTDVERESADTVLIDGMAQHEKELDEKLERTDALFAELQEEFELRRSNIRIPLPSIDESKVSRSLLPSLPLI